MKRIIIGTIILLSAFVCSRAEDFWIPELFNCRVNGLWASGDTILLATEGTGVMKSLDRGINWQTANKGLNVGGINDIVKVGNRFLISTDFEGLFMSTDYGSNWTQMNNNVRYKMPQKLKYYDGTVFMTSNSSGVYFSKDQGDSWTQCYNLGDNYIITFITKVDSVYFAAENTGVLYMSNSGFSWHEAGLRDVYVCDIAKKDSVLIAGTTNGVILSYNFSKTWVKSNLDSSIVTSFLSKDDYIIAGALNGIYKSIDNGINWRFVSYGLINLSCRKLIQNGNELYAASDDGMYISKDEGESWVPCHINDPAPRSVRTILNEDSAVYAGTDSKVFKSVDHGHKWKDVSSGLNNASINRIARSGFCLFAATGTGIFKSTDNGTSWKAANKDLGNLWAASISEYKGTLLAITASGLYKSTNYAESWSKLNIEFNVDSFSAIFNNGRAIFASSNSGEIFKSENNGLNWYKIYTGFYGWISNFEEGNTIYFGSDIGLFSTSDLGRTWNNLGLHGYRIKSVFKKGNWIFAGTERGFFYTHNSGITWTKDNTGLLNNDVGDIYANANELIIGTHGGGIHRHVCNILPAPKLFYPIEKESLKYLNADFTWDSIPNATSYKIQVAYDNNFTKIIYEKELSELNCTFYRFKTGINYYWRVQANSLFIPGEWSEIRSFNTTGTGIQAPSLINPQNDSIVKPFKLSFNWGTKFNCKKYQIQVSRDSLFTTLPINRFITEQSFIYNSNLRYDNIYYWRVKGFMDTDSTNWSEVWTFTTIKNPDFVESINDFCRVSPNPCEMYFRIDFNQTYNETIKLKLYNALGTLIFKEEFENNPESVKYDVSSYETGAYFLSIESGNKIQTFPIRIIK